MLINIRKHDAGFRCVIHREEEEKEDKKLKKIEQDFFGGWSGVVVGWLWGGCGEGVGC